MVNGEDVLSIKQIWHGIFLVYLVGRNLAISTNDGDLNKREKRAPNKLADCLYWLRYLADVSDFFCFQLGGGPRGEGRGEGRGVRAGAGGGGGGEAKYFVRGRNSHQGYSAWGTQNWWGENPTN